MDEIKAIIQSATQNVAPAITLSVYQRGQLLMHHADGWLDPDTREMPVTVETLFDLASLTKLFTTTACLVLLSQQNIPLNVPVVELVTEFGGVNPRPIAGGQNPHTREMLPTATHLVGHSVNPADVTLWHLLTHTSGLPPWRDVYTIAPPPEPDETISREERRSKALDRLVAYPFVDTIGTAVHYSDVGLMLLGEIVARLHGAPLDKAIQEYVLTPLRIDDVQFNPAVPRHHIAPTEFDKAWRGRRVWGEVHDENACGVGGIAGHAGLFGTTLSVAKFGLAWLRRETFEISDALWQEAIREQVNCGQERRGLGWMLPAGPNSSSGTRLSQQSIGHTGFTGTSLWIDPIRELVVALLTNRVYGGRDNTTAIQSLRRAVHDMLVEGIH